MLYTVRDPLHPKDEQPLFASKTGAQSWLDEVITLREGRPHGWSLKNSAGDLPADTVTLSFGVDNAYELIEDVHFDVVDAVVTAPTDGEDLDEWAQEHLMETWFTGIGLSEGDSSYSVLITASTIAHLVGKTFDWG